MCFEIRVSSWFQLAIQIISIHNLNCPKNKKKHRPSMLFGMPFQLLECSSNLNSRGYDCLLQYHLLPGLRVWNGGFGGNRLAPPCMWPTPTPNIRYLDKQFDVRVISRRALQKSCPHMHFFSIFGKFGFLKDIIWVGIWKGLEILISKHMWKSKIRLLQRNKTKIAKEPFFRDTL